MTQSTPSPQPCKYCGTPTPERIDGEAICLDCYVERGSCCQEQE